MTWRWLSKPDRDKEYVCQLTQIRLASYIYLPGFLWHQTKIQRQLRHAPGLVGYDSKPALWEKAFWTMSAWQDDQSLHRFSYQNPTAQTLLKFHKAIEHSPSKQLKFYGSELPLTWPELKRLLAPS